MVNKHWTCEHCELVYLSVKRVECLTDVHELCEGEVAHTMRAVLPALFQLAYPVRGESVFLLLRERSPFVAESLHQALGRYAITMADLAVFLCNG